MLYRIIKKNQNKIFWTIGQFECKYLGGSDVVNKYSCQEIPKKGMKSHTSKHSRL